MWKVLSVGAASGLGTPAELGPPGLVSFCGKSFNRSTVAKNETVASEPRRESATANHHRHVRFVRAQTEHNSGMRVRVISICDHGSSQYETGCTPVVPHVDLYCRSRCTKMGFPLSLLRDGS
jgi:hypothetical protein